MRDEPLIRQLSGLGVWLLVINGMIGAGIFGLPAEAARLAGALSPWIFVACAVLMLPILLSFAQLSSYFTGTGGPVSYAGAAFGPFAGFQAGWAFYVARLTAFSANLNLLVSAVGYFWDGANAGGVRLASLFLVTALFTAINVIGVRDAVRSLGALTLLKLLPLVLLVAVGLWQVPSGAWTPSETSVPAAPELGVAVLIVFYAYVGYESALVPAGEANDPRRDMPRALFWGLGVASVLYAALQLVSMAALPTLAETTRPLVEVGAALLGPTGAVLVTLGLIALVAGNLTGSMFSTPRVSYSLARDGYLPAWFGWVHPRFKTPAASILFYGLMCFLLAAYGSFVWLAGLSVLTRVLIYLACIGGLSRLEKRFGGEAGALALPGGRLIPAIAILVCVGLLSQVKGFDVLVTALFLGAGSLLYLIARRAQRRTERAA